MARDVCILLALLALASGVHCSTIDDTHYIAAVVDFSSPAMVFTGPEENHMENLKNVASFMEEASEQGVDIIVFAEDGLQGYSNSPLPMDIPDGNEQVTPCTTEDANIPKVLRELSCLAAKHKMYLVVNLVHGVPCSLDLDPKCPPRSAYHYNTNVAFDRSGKIVARYHKYHLFAEPENDVPKEVEYVTFDTDFGVKFGMIICFDMVFNKPSLELLRKTNIHDIVYSSAWFSQVPYFTAVQAHSGWAHALDVTVLSSGFNYPLVGSTGSGIFRGRHGILNATMNWRTESTMIVSRVPKFGHWDEELVEPRLERFDPVLNYNAGKEPFDDWKGLRVTQVDMTNATTALIERPVVGEVFSLEEMLCNNGLCCHFQVDARGVALFQTSAAASIHGYSRWRDAPTFDKTKAEEEFDGFYYRLVVSNAVHDAAGFATIGQQSCGLVACLNKEVASCGLMAPRLGLPSVKWTEFLRITVSGEFDKEGTLQMASTLAGPRFEPLPASVYTFESVSGRKAGQNTVTLSMNKTALLDIRTFGIFGRDFRSDSTPV